MTAPLNQLGEPATATMMETVTRLQEKAADNRGGANRERIRARIAGRFENSRAMSLQLPQRHGLASHKRSRSSRKNGRPTPWLVASGIAFIAAAVWTMRR